MNTFNRVAFIVILLVFVALAGALLVLPLESLDFAVNGLQSIRDSIAFDSQSYLVYIIALALFLILCLVLLYMEIRPSHKKTVLIRTEGGGKARIGVESVAQSLEYRIDELPGVRDVRPHVTSRGDDVQVVVDLRTSPTVNIPRITEKIVLMIREILEEQMGIKIKGDVEVNVAHEPFPRGTLSPGSTEGPAAERERPPEPVEEPRTARAGRTFAERPPVERPTAEPRPPAEVRPRPEERRFGRLEPREEPQPPAPPINREIVPEDEFDFGPQDLGLEEDQEERKENEPPRD